MLCVMVFDAHDYQASDVSDLEPHDGLEVVPLEPDDAEMWDANDENEDDLKLCQVKSTCSWILATAVN